MRTGKFQKIIVKLSSLLLYSIFMIFIFLLFLFCLVQRSFCCYLSSTVDIADTHKKEKVVQQLSADLSTATAINWLSQMMSMKVSAFEQS